MFEELLKNKSVSGVVCYEPQSAFSGPRIATFVYTDATVVASLIVSNGGAWTILPLLQGAPIHVDALDQIIPCLTPAESEFHRLIPSSESERGYCPEEINSWDKVRTMTMEVVRASTLRAGASPRPVGDVASYGCQVCDRTNVLRVGGYMSWMFPQPAQAALITAFSKLLARANLTPKQLEDEFGLSNRKPEPVPLLLVHVPDEDDSDEETRRTSKKPRKPWRKR